MATEESDELQVFPPLPVRERGVLEILDTSIKLYKQYFLVLIGWSSVTQLIGATGYFIGLFVLAIKPFVMVLPMGATVCAVAAAVRGQRISFKQCWQFTKPRYWPLVGVSLLAWLVMVLMIVFIFLAGGAIFTLGFATVQNASDTMQLFAFFVFIGSFGVMASVLMAVLFVWQNVVAIVICMEERHRNLSAMGRAYDLLRHNWIRLTTLISLIILAVGILIFFLTVALYLTGVFPAIRDIAHGRRPGAQFYESILGINAAIIVVRIIIEPYMDLVFALLYLDIRTRKEALDLEWAAHTTAPPITDESYPGYHANIAYGQANYPTQGYGPQGYSPQGYTPQSYTPPDFGQVAPASPPETQYPSFPTPAQQFPVTGYAPLPLQSNADVPVPTIQTGQVAPDVATQNDVSQPAPYPAACPFCNTATTPGEIYCLTCGARLQGAA